MPLRQILTPLDLTIHLGTPGCPVSYRETMQQEYASPDGLVRELVGEPSIVGGECRGDAIAAIVGSALVAAQAQAAASEARASEAAGRAEAAERLAAERLADAESVRQELATAVETIALLRKTLSDTTEELRLARAATAAPATDSIGPT